MWITEHEADVASDLSAFHRIDDPMTLDGPRYFSLATRLIAYAGICQAIYLYEREEEKKGNRPATRRTASAAGSYASPVEVVPEASALALLEPGWVEHVREGEDA